MKLYNTFGRKLEEFRPLNEKVKVYTCGPTVYSEAHIGNMTAYIYWDLLVRTLQANGYTVQRVLNLTDVGHLVSDGDEGDDKLEKGAKREGKTVYEVAERYIDLFKQDYHALELIEPEVWARATDYIKDDMRAVDLMTKRGFTYETSDGIYYDTAKFDRYADFAQLDLAGLQAGARIGFSDEKRNVSDFAVWKFIQPNEKHAMRWEYRDRPGYPGWHLECSTIIDKELGAPIDIHTGGVDHIPVHHTNEIAQYYAMTGRDLARYWLHCDFITIDNEKISKSLGNTYSLSDLKKRGFSPMDYKMWVLSGHYQGTRNFTFESLTSASTRRLNWRNRIAECYQRKIVSDDGIWRRVLAAVNDNLNSAEAFAVIDGAVIGMEDWKKIDRLFGLRLIIDSPDIDDETQALINKRQATREAKDYAKSDEIRNSLTKRGITIKDMADGPMWQYLQ